jgi:hypothetical protein
MKCGCKKKCSRKGVLFIYNFILKKSIQFALKCNALTCNASMYSKTSIIYITWSTCNSTIALCHYVHSKKRRVRCSTGLNNVLLPTLFTLVNNIEQYCWVWIGCNNIVQYCWQLWTMWATKHCSILFSSVLHQPGRFLPCSIFPQGWQTKYKFKTVYTNFNDEKNSYINIEIH